MRLFKRKQAAPPWRTGPNSIFTRASTAMLNGVQFASGVPRIDGGKILVEEGTTNLLTATQSNCEGLTGISQQGTATRLLSNSWKKEGSTSILCVGTDITNYISFSFSQTSGLTYTISAFVYNPNAENITVNINRGGTTSGTLVLAPGQEGRVVQTTTAGVTATTDLRLYESTGKNFHADCVQSENKGYATTWTLGGTTRAAESLAIPVGAVDLGGGVIDYSNAVLNPSAFTFEATIVCPANQNNSVNTIIQHYENGLSNINLTIASARQLVLAYATSSSASTSIIGTTTLTPGSVYHVKARADATGAKLTLNGVTEGVNSTPFVARPYITAPIYVGRAGNSQYRELNSSISNLRISRIARTDTEMAYTGPLKADSYTTFFRKYWR